jgi:hypothetical protein
MNLNYLFSERLLQLYLVKTLRTVLSAVLSLGAPCELGSQIRLRFLHLPQGEK